MASSQSLFAIPGALLAMGFTAGNAFAQVSPLASAAETVKLPEVVVTQTRERADGPVEGYRATRSATFGKYDMDLKDVPASLTIVPESLIDDTSMQSLADVFRYVPGTLAHQGEGNRDQIVIRGNSTTADFYVDGVRDDAQVFRDLYNVLRVEVLKGPAGMAFGRGSAGGVVNRVTKKPVFERLLDMDFIVGNYSQLRGTIDTGNKVNETVAWRFNGMAEPSNSFRDQFELERYAVNPTVTVAPNPNLEITFGYEHLYDSRTADRGIPSQTGSPFDTNPGRFFGNANQSRAHGSFDDGYILLSYDFGDRLTLKNALRTTHYDKFYQNVYPGSAVDANGNLALAAYNNANQRTNTFNQTDLTKTFNANGFENVLLVGVELGHQDSGNQRNTGLFGSSTTASVAADNPFAVATRFAATGTDAQNNVTADIAAIYVQDQIAFNKEWKAITGLRYDLFKVKFDDLRTTTTPTDLARTDRGTSPRFGLIWTPDPVSSYYASYSYAFLPSGEQLGLASTTADLGPETARNFEIGARWDLLPKLSLSLAAFRLYRDDVRVADPTNPGYFVKSGQQLTDGVEVGLQGTVTSWWQVFGGYSYTDARVNKAFNSGTAATVSTTIPAGNKVGLVPQNLFSLWNRFDFQGGWGSGLGLIYQGSSYTSFNNTVVLPAFTRADGALFYTFPDGKTRLALNVENMFDTKYFPTADGDNNISPGAPRSARVTLSTSF